MAARLDADTARSSVRSTCWSIATSLRTVFAMIEGELRQRILSREASGFRVEHAISRTMPGRRRSMR